MAGAKEIRTKIRSIQNTQKITKAMEMVAASKMRKAQDRMAATRPYAQKMREVVSHVAAANTEYVHLYMQPREEVKRVGYIVISTESCSISLKKAAWTGSTLLKMSLLTQ